MNEALILAKLATIEAMLAQLLAGGGASSGASASGVAPDARSGGRVASDDDLDSDRGDPTIRFDPKPKYWPGASFVGYRFSEVPDPAYLDAMAKYLDACAYMAGQSAKKGQDVEKNEKSARFKALDAARARGWAARLRKRGGVVSQSTTSTEYTTTDDEIPF